MRPILCLPLLVLAACSAPFSAASPDLSASDSATAPDAGRDDDGGMGPAVDGGSVAEGSTGAVRDGGADMGHDAERDAAGEAEAGPTPIEGCVAYFAARAKGCACVAVYHGCDQQVTDAGDCPSSLGVCQASCDYDGGGGSAALCYCIFSCLAATGGGSCLLPNQGYMTCDVSDCNASNCP